MVELSKRLKYKYFKNNKIKEKMKAILSEFDKIILGYIFGSVLKQNKFHDLDVAVYIKEDKLTPYKLFKLEMEIARKLEARLGYKIEVDVKILNYLPLYFQYMAIKEGIPVFVKNRLKRIDYETEIITRYQDYKVTLDWFDQQIILRKKG